MSEHGPAAESPPVARVAASACPRCGCYVVHDDKCGCGACTWSTCANCCRDTARAPGDLEGGLTSYARCDSGPTMHEHVLPPRAVRLPGRGGYVFTAAG